jgi:hypothetical protein
MAPKSKPCRLLQLAATDSHIIPKVATTAACLGPIFVRRTSPQKPDPIGPFLWFFLLGPAKERTFNRKNMEPKEACTRFSRKEKQQMKRPFDTRLPAAQGPIQLPRPKAEKQKRNP